MTEEEQDVLSEISELNKARHLWKSYGIDWWHRNDYPAPVLDKLLKLDHIESVVQSEPPPG